MPGIANFSTTVDVSTTVGKINAALARRGVTRISTAYDENGSPAGIEFTMKTPYGLRDFALPVRVDKVQAALVKEGHPASKTGRSHAAKVAWRIAEDWLKAQAALIDAELASLDEVMMPYMVGDRGQTFYAIYRGQQKELGA